MSESSELTNPPYPQQRTPEQHDAVRRRSLPLAFCALVCGVLAIVLLLTRPVAVDHPPNVLAVNLSFCALLMGAGILLYAKGTPRTGTAAALAVAGLLSGLVGPMIYARQTVAWRMEVEGRELRNGAAVAHAAKAYALEHGGAYPADLMVLLEEKRITPETLISPFGATAPLTDDVAALRAKFPAAQVLTTIDAHSDYTYVGGDLKLPVAATGSAAGREAEELPREIVVVYAKAPVMRTNLAVTFADGSAKFITLEQAEEVLKACNAARVKLGLPELRRPESVERALRGTEEK